MENDPNVINYYSFLYILYIKQYIPVASGDFFNWVCWMVHHIK